MENGMALELRFLKWFMKNYLIFEETIGMLVHCENVASMLSILRKIGIQKILTLISTEDVTLTHAY